MRQFQVHSVQPLDPETAALTVRGLNGDLGVGDQFTLIRGTDGSQQPVSLVVTRLDAAQGPTMLLRAGYPGRVHIAGVGASALSQGCQLLAPGRRPRIPTQRQDEDPTGEVTPEVSDDWSRKRLAGVLSAVGVVVVGAVVGAVVLFGGQQHHPVPQAVVSNGAHVSAAHTFPARWDSRILPIVSFVQKQRGLTFQHPVAVLFLSDAAFKKKVTEPAPTTKADRDELNRTVSELRALGLVQGNLNLLAANNNLQQTDVVGFYSFIDKKVYVRGTTLTPYVRVTLAHELTHALQDQYFDLNALEKANRNNDSDALTSLIEGDAVTVQNAYVKQMSSADRAAYGRTDSQYAGSSSGNVPAILEEFQGFPYAFGPAYVQYLLYISGGTDQLDAAFRNPPVSAAQILDPVRYPLTWKPTPVAPPALPAGARRLAKPQPFGQQSLFEMLSSRLSYDESWAAVQGWRGDTTVPYGVGGRTCMAISVAMSDSGPANHLAAAARDWARGIPGAIANASGRMVTIRSCDPGPNVAPLPHQSPSPFDLLAARAAVINVLMAQQQLGFAFSRCTLDGVMAQLGPARESLILADTFTPSQQAVFVQAVARAAYSCHVNGDS